MARMIRRARRARALLLLALGLPACGGGDDCPRSIEAYCASPHAVCPMTFQDAQDPASWPCGESIALKVCEDVYIAAVVGPDPGDVYYYFTNGAGLYRIEGYDASTGGTACVAGDGEVFDCMTSTAGLTGTNGCP
jgi:hypothetical protein